VSRALVVATGVTANGDREVLGVGSGDSEDGSLDRLPPESPGVTERAADGATNRKIAENLFTSTSTVDYHLPEVCWSSACRHAIGWRRRVGARAERGRHRNFGRRRQTAKWRSNRTTRLRLRAHGVRNPSYHCNDARGRPIGLVTTKQEQSP
jgi:hypothetical protein